MRELTVLVKEKSKKTTFDQLSRKGRSDLMSKIKSKNTKPEIRMRKALHRDGLRYRIHRKDLPGKPDISVAKYNIAIEVRGCFWHGHSRCKNGHVPRKNTDFWKNKLQTNKARDRRNEKALESMGYRVFVIWECEMQNQQNLNKALLRVYDYLNQNFGLNLRVQDEKSTD